MYGQVVYFLNLRKYMQAFFSEKGRPYAKVAVDCLAGWEDEDRSDN